MASRNAAIAPVTSPNSARAVPSPYRAPIEAESSGLSRIASRYEEIAPDRSPDSAKALPKRAYKSSTSFALE